MQNNQLKMSPATIRPSHKRATVKKGPRIQKDQEMIFLQIFIYYPLVICCIQVNIDVH